MKIKFWGVRGSVPVPLTGSQVEAKILDRLVDYRDALVRSGSAGGVDPVLFLQGQPLWKRGTYGGNTPCVELLCGSERFVLDMGTGMRALGNNLIPQMFAEKSLRITFCCSHLHWDHIQGLPFFAPLYVNKESGVRNCWVFYGGTKWQETAEVCLRGQMDPPKFPVSWQEIRQKTHAMDFASVYDMMKFGVGEVEVKTRQLNHPQETYGWRFTFQGKVFAFTTDNEPYDPRCPDPRLLDLARGADVWVTDCQYTKNMYEGRNGNVVPRHGWGHSYVEAVAETAVQARAGQVVLFHHDPTSSDEKIAQMEARCRELIEEANGTSQVTAAHEGMEITL